MRLPAAVVLLAHALSTAHAQQVACSAATLDARTRAVNAECCDEPEEDCSSGRPATCNVGCARVLVPFFDDCNNVLGTAARQFESVVALCPPSPAGADGTDSRILELVQTLQARVDRLEGAAAGGHHAAAPPGTCTEECVVSDFGAVGDGKADDRDALQSAIDAARSQNKTLRFPAGTYRITKYLDWGLWTGISVRGELPGSAGIGLPRGVTTIFADAIEGTAHDFTASSYGIVQGIAFYGVASGAMVLNGKTLPRGYGSDITYRDCNFGGGRKGSFVNHMGEVLTWDNCRFHGGRNAPGLLITWKAGDPNTWNITAPSGRALQTAVSVTVFRMLGGEATGDNGPLVVLDMEGAPHGGGDFISTGAYFSTFADHVSAVQVRGTWSNVIIDGSRDEEDIKPADPDCGFVELASGHLRTFRITGYGDGDEGCPVLRGNGSVADGSIVAGGSGINITRGDMVRVDVSSGSTVRLVVNGSVEGCRWRSTQRDGNHIDVR